MDFLLYIVGFIVVVSILALLMQRWFWLLLIGLGILASVFSVLASIIHFQILSAVGFSVLTLLLFFIAGILSEMDDPFD